MNNVDLNNRVSILEIKLSATEKRIDLLDNKLETIFEKISESLEVIKNELVQLRINALAVDHRVENITNQQSTIYHTITTFGGWIIAIGSGIYSIYKNLGH